MLDRLEDLLRRARAGGRRRGRRLHGGGGAPDRAGPAGSRREAQARPREPLLGSAIFAESGSASATTSDLSPAALARLVDESVRLAQVDPARRALGAAGPRRRSRRDVPDLEPVGRRRPRDGGSRTKIDWARRAEAAALEADPRVRNSEGAEFYDRQGRVAYASSRGFAGGFRGLVVRPVGDAGCLATTATWSATTGTRRPGVSRDLEAPEAVGREAARRAVRRLGGRKGETTEVPVVFDPETAASLIRALAGAPRPARASTAGTSFLVGRRGEDRRVAPRHDRRRSAACRSGLGSRPFDGEGLPSRRTVLVDRGRARELPPRHLQRAAARARGDGARRPRGRRRRDAWATRTSTSSPGPGRPRRSSRSVDRGLYVTELIGFGVNFVTGDYSRGAVGFWIEGGELDLPGRGDHDRRQPAADAAGRRDGGERPRVPRPDRSADAQDLSTDRRRPVAARRRSALHGVPGPARGFVGPADAGGEQAPPRSHQSRARGRSAARLAEPLGRVLVAGLERERALEGRPGPPAVAQPEVAPAETVVEARPLGRGPEGALERVDRLGVSPDVVEAPRQPSASGGRVAHLTRRRRSSCRGAPARAAGSPPRSVRARRAPCPARSGRPRGRVRGRAPTGTPRSRGGSARA